MCLYSLTWYIYIPSKGAQQFMETPHRERLDGWRWWREWFDECIGMFLKTNSNNTRQKQKQYRNASRIALFMPKYIFNSDGKHVRDFATEERDAAKMCDLSPQCICCSSNHQCLPPGPAWSYWSHPPSSRSLPTRSSPSPGSIVGRSEPLTPKLGVEAPAWSLPEATCRDSRPAQLAAPWPPAEATRASGAAVTLPAVDAGDEPATDLQLFGSMILGWFHLLPTSFSKLQPSIITKR
jgi:hypothetical protein